MERVTTFHRRRPPMTDKSRWLALYVLCLGDLMIVLDQSIVNVSR